MCLSGYAATSSFFLFWQCLEKNFKPGEIEQFIDIYFNFLRRVMECLLVFGVVIFAGFIQLVVAVLTRLKLIDSDSEFEA